MRTCLGVGLALLSACSSLRPQPSPDAGKLWALVINGGRRPAENYQSHLLHVRQLLGILATAGVDKQRLGLFVSDGTDPAADLATRAMPPEIPDSWRLEGTPAGQLLAVPVELENSRLEGFEVQAATRQAISNWLATVPIEAGDTLLLYVTDHGNLNRQDNRNNSISLWGEKEDLNVEDLRAALARLPRGTRVVSVMSQCFSGSFAGVDLDGQLAATTCGYFASTASRPAYGCYPENRGVENVGHSFHFLSALADSGELREAHTRTLVSDDTPDTPRRTTDAFLDALIGQAAAAEKGERNAFVDALLRDAWRDAASWEAEIRLLDRIARRFGYASPRSLADLQRQTNDLPGISAQMKRVSTAWKGALADANRATYENLQAATTKAGPLLPASLTSFDTAARTRRARDLASQMREFAVKDPERDSLLRTLHERGHEATATRYRMEVRLAALLRLEALLVRIAGLQFLRTRGSAEQRSRFDSLESCEDLRLSTAPTTPAAAIGADFPPFEEDVRRAQAALPSFLGIQFRDLDASRRASLRLPRGAASLLAVFPDTPAARAGLAAGDIVWAADGTPFTQSNQIRQWSMLAPAGAPAILKVIHEGEARTVRLVPAPHPLEWPKLPGPPPPGSVAPTLRSLAYRGTVPAAWGQGRKHVLFFWATWCAICKAALPELTAYAEQSGAKVVAITDEPADVLDRYFQQAPAGFPEDVATDLDRRDFNAFGVSGSPTFVLVDESGHIEAMVTGYARDRGLSFPGWKWSAPPGP